jgi:hypothetical protein
MRSNERHATGGKRTSLGLTFIAPELRHGTGETDAAAAAPSGLVDVGHLW